MSRSLSLRQSHTAPVGRFLPADAPPRAHGLLGRLVHWQDRWRQRRDLETLSEAQLADIGLTRVEVHGWAGDVIVRS